MRSLLLLCLTAVNLRRKAVGKGTDLIDGYMMAVSNVPAVVVNMVRHWRRPSSDRDRDIGKKRLAEKIAGYHRSTLDTKILSHLQYSIPRMRVGSN